MKRAVAGVVSIVLLCAALTLPARVDAATNTFSNSSSIGLSGYAPASSYPSQIAVSGLSSKVTKVTLTLHNLSHPMVNQFQGLLEGPEGQTVIFYQGEGGNTAASNVTITFDDTADKTIRHQDGLQTAASGRTAASRA